MTQQEIFQNMTKGEWKVGGYNLTLFVEHSTDDSYSSALIAKFEQNKPEIDEPNVLAAASAVNNTYGKGINPESVEKMRKQLWDALSMMGELSNLVSTDQWRLIEKRYIKVEKESREALTAAKLT